MYHLTKMSIGNRGLIILASIAILIFGAFVIPSINQELLPSLQFPAVTIVSIYPGASPSIVEQNVTNPIEQAIQGVSGVTQTVSYSNEGSSLIEVEYDYGTDTDTAAQKLSQQIASIQSTLPTNVTPQVKTFDTNALPILQLAVTSSEDQTALSIDLKNIVVPALQAVNGVANVNLTGVTNPIITVTLDPQKLQTLGVSAQTIQGALQGNNATIPAGELTANGQTYAVRVKNSLTSLSDIEHIIVGQHTVLPAGCPAVGATAATGTGGYPGGASTAAGSYPGATGTQGADTAGCQPQITPVTLGDVATVTQSVAPSSTLTRTNSKPSLGISIIKANNANTVNVSHDVQAQFNSLAQKIGHNTRFTVISDQAPSITDSINSLIHEGLIGALFAILVILLFLLSVRSMLVTAISIPLSIVIALIGLWVGGYTLNILTLAGLTIAIGRVVDDSIVVLENIYRHLQRGEPREEAIPLAVKEVGGAVTASTLTTVAVFLPLGFTTGIVGELFRSFALTVTIALLASLLVAMLVIPVLCYWFLKVKPSKSGGKIATDHDEHITFLEKGYTPIIRWVTGHRVITLIVAVLLLIGTLAMTSRLATNFLGSSQQNTLSISETLPVGTSLDQVSLGAQKIENVLHGLPGKIQSYQVVIGNAQSAFGGGSGSAASASFTVTLADNADPTAVQNTLQSRFKSLQGIGTVQFQSSSQSFGSSAITVNVQANDNTTLQKAANQVLAAVKKVSNVTNVNSNLANAAPLIDVQVNAQEAAAHGLAPAQVGQVLAEVYTGVTATTVTINGQQLNVELKLNATTNSINGVNNILLPTQTGNVRLGDIATVTQDLGPVQITHNNGTRTATISATPTIQNTGGVSANIQKAINNLKLPAGATATLGGATQQQNDAFSSLGLALLIAILLVFVVMVATFRSIIYPLILLVSIPFAATGSLLLLLLTNSPLGLPALIGMLMLVGIVVTNAIVLLDLVLQYRAKGLDARSAVIEGGRRRLRPILMTAIATICALLPLALGFSGSSGVIAAPLAVTVIGGLTTSTLLTLLLVPTLYVMVAGKRGASRPESSQPAVETQTTAPLPEYKAMA